MSESKAENAQMTGAGLNNQLFACASWSGESLKDSIKLPGLMVLPSSTAHSGQWRMELLFTPKTNILSGGASDHNAYAYVWGPVVHPYIQASEIPGWVARVIADRHYEPLRELLGCFVILVEQPADRRLSVVSDILGVQPFFYRSDRNRVIFGSNAWSLYHAGLTSGEVDLDAVSSWILQGCNYTDKTLFSDLHRLDAGSVMIFEENRRQNISYVRFRVANHKLSSQVAAESIHSVMKPVCKALYSQHKKMNVALSGGFDSRYCLAMALESNADIAKITTVSFTKEEGQIAAEVASAFGLELETLPVEGSTWDIYGDDVYHFTPDGFPITKFVTHCLAEHYPGLPMVNGYLGGPLLRSYEFKGFKEPNGKVDWPGLLLEQNFFVTCPERLERWFGKDLAQHVLERARNAMAAAIDKGESKERLLSWADLYFAQRFYYSNNFLQHLHLAEAVLPLYSYSLIAFKLDHHPSVLSRETCVNMFRTYFPKVAGFPHSHDLELEEAARRNSSTLGRLRQFPKVARCTAKWARQLLPALMDSDCMSGLQKKRLIPYTLASSSYFLQRLSHRLAESAEASIFNFERFYLLEKRCREANINLDWQSI